METSVHSFEKRSISDSDRFRNNRLIVVNRREPDVFWSTPNQPIKSQYVSNWLLKKISYCCSCCFGQVSGCCRYHEQDTLKYNSRRKLRTSVSTSLVDEQYYDSGPFVSNEWKTSKYTLWNFLPKNLFEQLRRLANFYFLTTAILQLVIPFSPVGPTTSFLPLTFVIATTAVKQAYEDYLRHKLDKEVNSRMCHVLKDKKLVRVRSKDIRVGDIVYVKNNEEIPCDMILLASSGTGDRCYVTTVNLDGETSLKGRTCYLVKNLIGNIEKIDNTLLVVECEQPNATLYEFNGILRAPKDDRDCALLLEDIMQMQAKAPQAPARNKTSQAQHQQQQQSEHAHQQQRVASAAPTTTANPTPPPNEWQRKTIYQRILYRIKRPSLPVSNKPSISSVNQAISDNKSPRDGQQALARGESMAAKTIDLELPVVESSTEHIEIALDINNLLLRASKLRNTNHIYGLVVHTGRDTKLAHNSQVKPNKFSSTESRVNMFLLIAFGILVSLSIISAATYTSPSEWYLERLPKADSFIELLLAHFLLYNYIVPISLYVTLEFIKFFGTMSVINDSKLRTTVWTSVIKSDEVNGNTTSSKQKKILTTEGPQCNSSDLNEDLGQVEVLFTDKTGTLTENKMHFMACSIYGQLYRCVSRSLYLEPPGSCRIPVINACQHVADVRVNRYAALNPSVTTSVRRSSKIQSTLLSPKDKPFDHNQVPALSEMKLIESLEDHEKVVEFFMCLCLCSTITLNENLPLEVCLPNKLVSDYQSASPDEESLISAAAQFGVTMCKSNEQECFIAIRRSPVAHRRPQHPKGARTRYTHIIETKNSTEHYIVRHFERLISFEFDSTRKRMSVIYRDCDNDCFVMFTKGSESVLDCVRLNHIGVHSEQQVNMILAHFEAFAKSGLRTMLVARRFMDAKELKKIQEDLRVARLSSNNREQSMYELYQRVESNMNFVGTTAVEDTLQANVPETIAKLKESGVRVWLLTGDKVETAVSVAHLCKLLDREMSLLYLVRQQNFKSCQESMEAICRELNNTLMGPNTTTTTTQSLTDHSMSRASVHSSNESKRTTNFSFIVDGRSLHYAMKYARKELEFVCKHCVCVLGCRLSPLQKAEVVEMVKSADDRPITAAIGDGANDVSMIQEAHVGIGVSGKEGRQAVNSSDFAIKRFHMLRRLFFVHGNLFYHRTANTIHYFFYKNILFVFPQFLYIFYNLSSAATLYHPLMLISYNLVFTSLPILIYGLQEEHIEEQYLERFPKLYKINSRNYQMRFSAFFTWILTGALQGLIAFQLLQYNWGSHRAFLESGQMAGTTGFSLMLFLVIVLTATFRLYLLARKHGFFFNLASMVSVLMLPAMFVIVNYVDTSAITSINLLYRQVMPLLESPMFWLAVVSTTAATLVPDLLFSFAYPKLSTF